MWNRCSREDSVQNKKKIDNTFFIGPGKVKELALLVQVTANLIIFDDDLSGVQLKNLEEAIGCKVIDRAIAYHGNFCKKSKALERQNSSWISTA